MAAWRGRLVNGFKATRHTRFEWGLVRRALTRPYPVTLPMVALVSMVPFYLVIAGRSGTAYAPALGLDGLIPLVPAWALVYGALYLWLILLPVLVIQQRELIRRTVWAYLMVWIAAYICFIIYPTIAPRPELVAGDGFSVRSLRFLYDADPPYNCFPSLHVAHAFVSALALLRVHRTLGVFSLGTASLVALSTLFTKQHYVVDIVGGVVLALAAYTVLLRGHPRSDSGGVEHRVAPALGVCVGGLSCIAVVGAWLLHYLT